MATQFHHSLFSQDLIYSPQSKTKQITFHLVSQIDALETRAQSKDAQLDPQQVSKISQKAALLEAFQVGRGATEPA